MQVDAAFPSAMLGSVAVTLIFQSVLDHAGPKEAQASEAGQIAASTRGQAGTGNNGAADPLGGGGAASSGGGEGAR